MNRSAKINKWGIVYLQNILKVVYSDEKNTLLRLAAYNCCDIQSQIAFELPPTLFIFKAFLSFYGDLRRSFFSFPLLPIQPPKIRK